MSFCCLIVTWSGSASRSTFALPGTPPGRQNRCWRGRTTVGNEPWRRQERSGREKSSRASQLNPLLLCLSVGGGWGGRPPPVPPTALLTEAVQCETTRAGQPNEGNLNFVHSRTSFLPHRLNFTSACCVQHLILTRGRVPDAPQKTFTKPIPGNR